MQAGELPWGDSDSSQGHQVLWGGPRPGSSRGKAKTEQPELVPVRIFPPGRSCPGSGTLCPPSSHILGCPLSPQQRRATIPCWHTGFGSVPVLMAALGSVTALSCAKPRAESQGWILPPAGSLQRPGLFMPMTDGQKAKPSPITRWQSPQGHPIPTRGPCRYQLGVPQS